MMTSFGRIESKTGQVVGQVCASKNRAIQPKPDRSDRFGQVFKRSILHARHKGERENLSKCVQMRPNRPGMSS